jgi:uncharacterized heparinase superfamily protein
MHKLKLYYYTLKDLEPIQIRYRFYYIFKRKLYERIGSTIQKRYSEKYKNTSIKLNLNSNMLINNRTYYFYDLEKVLNNQITFLNREIDFGLKIDWHRDELNRGTKLWKLNLHYHDFLFDIALKYKNSSDERYFNYLIKTIDEWIEVNPIGTKGYGGDNWNSYCLSLRIVSWIKIYLHLEDKFSSSFKEKFIESLWIQGAFLYDNLELDILGNHLIKNYKALYFLGEFFKIERYIKRAERLYQNHIDKQFTPAGMHEELSPMYSAIILEDLIEVYLITDSKELENLIHKQYQLISYLIGTDSKFTYFNDSINKNGIEFKQLESLYQKVFLQNSTEKSPYTFNFDGYLGFENNQEKLIFDAGDVVKGNQAGHGQCDALSFEYFLGEEKLFTNSGLYEYNSGDRRLYSRSTKAHNTLSFNQLEQSEIWSSFRMARRAKVGFDLKELTTSSIKVEGFIEGFDFEHKIIHKRTLIKEKNELTTIDSVESDQNGESEIFFHLMPPFRFENEENQLVIKREQREIATVELDAPYTILTTPLYPEFGKEISKSTLCIQHLANSTSTMTIFKFLEK